MVFAFLQRSFSLDLLVTFGLSFACARTDFLHYFLFICCGCLYVLCVCAGMHMLAAALFSLSMVDSRDTTQFLRPAQQAPSRADLSRPPRLLQV